MRSSPDVDVHVQVSCFTAWPSHVKFFALRTVLKLAWPHSWHSASTSLCKTTNIATGCRTTARNTREDRRIVRLGRFPLCVVSHCNDVVHMIPVPHPRFRQFHLFSVFVRDEHPFISTSLDSVVVYISEIF